MAKKIEGYLKLQIPAGKANPSPPVGPALGQRGLNIMEFCKAFNANTQEMEPGAPCPTVITYYVDKSFSMDIKTPPASFFLKKASGLKAGGPFTGESYDAAALLILAMQSAGSTDGAAIASNVMGVANAPGEKIMPGELAKGLRILANGGAVDYVGATNVELTGVGEASGSYREFEIRNKAFQTVRFR